MAEIKIGLIGCGTMGTEHLESFKKVDGLRCAAICDIDAQRVAPVAKEQSATFFDDPYALIESDEVDAILIATPHFSHPPYAEAAFKRGVHVLTEKPVAVTAKAAQGMNDAYEAALKQHPDLVFACMFQQRLKPRWRRVKQIIDDGQLGDLVRVSWTMTDWFRTNAYYESGSWRATWGGEGGGVLLNQCPHNLDLIQWFVGLPQRVTAIAQLGRYHDIEVEDDVTAILEYPGGAIGTFVTSTGQSPGINRLEIAGDHGTLIADLGKPLVLRRTELPVSQFNRETPERFAAVPFEEQQIDLSSQQDPEHGGIIENFVAVIRGDAELVAPGVEGIRSLELGNAMLMSGLRHHPVDLPMDRDAYEALLNELIAGAEAQTV